MYDHFTPTHVRKHQTETFCFVATHQTRSNIRHGPLHAPTQVWYRLVLGDVCGMAFLDFLFAPKTVFPSIFCEWVLPAMARHSFGVAAKPRKILSTRS